MFEEKDEIREKLEEAFKQATSTEDLIKLGNLLNQYNSNDNERKKNESKIKLDQDIHEDELRKERDLALIEDKRVRRENIKYIIDTSMKAIGGIFIGLLSLYAVGSDNEGHPLFGTGDRIASQCFNTLFRRK